MLWPSLFPWRSVKVKYSVLTLAVGAVAGALLLTYVLRSTKSLLEQSLEQRANALARSAAFQSEFGLLIANPELLNNVLLGISREEDYVGGVVYARDQRPIALGGVGAEAAWIKTLPPPARVSGPQVHRLKSPSGKTLVDVWMPVLPQKNVLLGDDLWTATMRERAGSLGTVRLLFSTHRTDLQIRKAFLKSVFWLVPLLGLAVLAMLISIRRLIEPILTLATAAHKVGQGEFQPIPSFRRRDELAELGAAFNRMILDLKVSREELERWNRELEARVERRSRELKEAQEKLAQSSKMAAVGQLAGGVAHEINNPLEVIQGFADRLVKRLHDNEQMLFAAQSILREASRCKQLVEDLLVFSHTGKKELEVLDLNEAVRHALLLIGAQARFKTARLETSLYAESLPIRANKNQILQIVINLVTNALDAMPQGGILAIHTAVARIQERPWAELAVADTGTGIPPEIRDRIFEPFFTTKEVGRGTGLGLSLVYEIVRLHGAVLDFQSEPGKGTTFCVRWSLQEIPPSSFSSREKKSS